MRGGFSKVWMRTALLCAVVALATSRDAEARWYDFATEDQVLPHASHVVRVGWPPTEQGWPVETVYRGAPLPEHIQIEDLPSLLNLLLRLELRGKPSIRRDPDRVRKGRVHVAGFVFALYAMDGRFHVVGGRPGHGVPSYSSLWLLSKEGRAYRYGRGMLGGAMPRETTHPSLEAFETHLRAHVLNRPFEGIKHTPLPAAEREAFLAASTPGINWYTRQAASSVHEAAPRIALTNRIATYGRTAPDSMTLHVFDALQILAGGRHVPPTAVEHAAERMLELVERTGIEPVAEFVIDQLASGPYIATNRQVLLWILKQTDAALYRRGVETLRALCRRRNDNEAVGAYWALKALGEELVVAEIDALWAEWDKDDPTSQLLREVEAAEQRRKQAEAATLEEPREPAPRPPPRIEVGGDGAASERAPPTPDESPEDSPWPWLLGCVLLAALAVFLARQRR